VACLKDGRLPVTGQNYCENPWGYEHSTKKTMYLLSGFGKLLAAFSQKIT
jgi:hypothetical protein